MEGEGLSIHFGVRAAEHFGEVDNLAFAADLDGDEKLDIVSGNYSGLFVLFRGEGHGRFESEATWLWGDGEVRKKEQMQVTEHGDPFLVDWDADGDLDLLSGSGQGGAFLFPNVGSRTDPHFGKRVQLLEPPGYRETNELGDAHLTGPSTGTRLWVEDLNGDGKLDLSVGDNVTLYHAAEGVSDKTAKEKLAAWRTAVKALDQKDFAAQYERLERERDAFVREDRTGFVWVYYGR